MSTHNVPTTIHRSTASTTRRVSRAIPLLLCIAGIACDAGATDEFVGEPGTDTETNFRTGFVVPDWQKGEVLPHRFHERFMSLAATTPVTARVEDTYQAGSTTTGGWAHVQGLGWSPGGTWAITHSQPQYATESLLVLCEDPTTDPGDAEGCYHHAIGNDHHGGGATQIVGGVLATADEVDNPALYDIRNPANPVEMTQCDLPENVGGATGLTWDPIEAVHVASFGGAIYKSNGARLDSTQCAFERVGTLRVDATGEGLSQLFFDPYAEKLVAIGGVRSGGQQLMYQYFDLAGSKEPRVQIELEGPGFNRGPSLRWAGTVRVSPDRFDVALAARGLGAAQGMRIGVYESSVSTNLDQGVYAFSGGQYHGCFPQTLQPWGPALAPDNNWAWNWPSGWETIDAAFFNAGVWTFIKGSQFIEKQHGSTAVGSIQPLSALASNWPASWDRVDAAVRHDNGAIYFFRDSKYLRYEPATNTIGSWYLQSPRNISGNFAWDWPAWDHVDAAVNGGDGFIYFVRDGEALAYDMSTSGASIQAPAFPCSFEGDADAMTSR